MKILLTIISLCICTLVNAQMATEQIETLPDVNLHLELVEEDTKKRYNSQQVGPYIALAGVGFLIGALTTEADKEFKNGHWQTQPIWRQGSRGMALLTGITATGTGIVFTIGGY